MYKAFFLLFLFSFTVLWAQKSYPKGDYHNPIGIPNYLSGNFGELRNNHFHSGIDIKTNQKTGYRVYAIDDGWVSRINVSPRGYGNAVYIDHPNGYTSVYAHLESFNEEIETFVRNYQYENELSVVEVYPQKDELLIKKGEKIALSGNSGSSGGPHLHFEIRDTQTEEPINPFLFGFDIPDSKTPLINGLYVYPINGDANGSKSRIAVSNNASISASGKIGFGIKTYDKQNGADNNNGTYQINLWVNDEPYFTFTAERTNFSTTRAINRLIDYADKNQNYSWVYRLFQPEGNPLQMFSNVKNQGILNLEEGKTYKIRMEAIDFAGNKNTAHLTVTGKKPPGEPTPKQGIIFHWNQENNFQQDEIKLNMPKGVIYDDIEFQYRKTNNGKYAIHDWDYPVHTYYTLGIKADGISVENRQKAILKREYKYRGTWRSEYINAAYKDGYITGQTRDFGVFSIDFDTTAPTINPINIKENSTFTAAKGVIRFTIKDDKTGIAGFKAHVDGKWILSYYDQKTASLTIDLNREGVTKGKHELELKVWDEKNNTATYNVHFNKN